MASSQGTMMSRWYADVDCILTTTVESNGCFPDARYSFGKVNGFCGALKTLFTSDYRARLNDMMP